MFICVFNSQQCAICNNFKLKAVQPKLVYNVNLNCYNNKGANKM